MKPPARWHAGALDRLRQVWHRIQPLRPQVLIRRARHRVLNRASAPDELVLRRGVRLRVHPDAREGFEHFCYRSPAMVRELDSFLAVARERSAFVDVGALHGVFALAFAALRPRGRVVAVEPSAVARRVLEANLELNGCSRIELEERALAAARGTVRMFQSWQHLEVTTLESVRAVSIETTTLDELAERFGLVPDLLKIDVEGYELEVLRGAARVLARRPWIFLEVHPERLPELGGDMASLCKLLQAHGYRVPSQLWRLARRPRRIFGSPLRVLLHPGAADRKETGVGSASSA